MQFAPSVEKCACWPIKIATAKLVGYMFILVQIFKYLVISVLLNLLFSTCWCAQQLGILNSILKWPGMAMSSMRFWKVHK